MESVRFHDSKLKLLKALLFRSFHETEAPTAGFCSVFICGRAYFVFEDINPLPHGGGEILPNKFFGTS